MNLIPHSRKVRCDSVLDGLTHEQKQQLSGWLGEENRGYEEVQRLVAEHFGMVTSRSALSRYYRRQRDAWQARREEVAPLRSEDLAAWQALPPEAVQTIEHATLARARQLAFHAIAERQPDLKCVGGWMRIATGLERARIERERAELEVRRVEIKERELQYEEAQYEERQSQAEQEATVRAAEEGEAPVERMAGPIVARGVGGTEARAGELGEASCISRIFLDPAA